MPDGRAGQQGDENGCKPVASVFELCDLLSLGTKAVISPVTRQLDFFLCFLQADPVHSHKSQLILFAPQECSACPPPPYHALLGRRPITTDSFLGILSGLAWITYSSLNPNQTPYYILRKRQMEKDKSEQFVRTPHLRDSTCNDNLNSEIPVVSGLTVLNFIFTEQMLFL